MADPLVVKPGDSVDVTYVAYDAETGAIVDTSVKAWAKAAGVHDPKRRYGPKRVVVGQHRVVPGFEEALVGMAVGEEKEVHVPPEKGYGVSGDRPFAGKTLWFRLTVEDVNGSRAWRVRLRWALKDLIS